jgi:hypothetical protein
LQAVIRQDEESRLRNLGTSTRGVSRKIRAAAGAWTQKASLIEKNNQGYWGQPGSVFVRLLDAARIASGWEAEGRKRQMGSVVTLLALSALMGFALARPFSWLGLGIAGVALALLSAAVLHLQGFGVLSGIAIAAACLTVNQASYLAAWLYASRRSEDPIQQQANDKPSRGRNKYVGYDH